MVLENVSWGPFDAFCQLQLQQVLAVRPLQSTNRTMAHYIVTTY